jgi:hypothetical protein
MASSQIGGRIAAAEIPAPRDNPFSFGRVILAVETANQFVFLVGTILQTVETLCSAREEERQDDKNKISQQKKLK